MPVVAKSTSNIFVGNWTTVQQWLTAGNEFANTLPLDNLGGPGPYLVHERGIWKYPQQAAGGAFRVPVTHGMPVRLVSLLADLGDSADWTLHVVGPAANVSGTPYDAADAALYTEGDVTIQTGSGRYISENFNIVANGTTALIFPGQTVYMTTNGANAPMMRLTIASAYDMK